MKGNTRRVMCSVLYNIFHWLENYIHSIPINHDDISTPLDVQTRYIVKNTW